MAKGSSKVTRARTRLRSGEKVRFRISTLTGGSAGAEGLAGAEWFALPECAAGSGRLPWTEEFAGAERVSKPACWAETVSSEVRSFEGTDPGEVTSPGEATDSDRGLDTSSFEGPEADRGGSSAGMK